VVVLYFLRNKMKVTQCLYSDEEGDRSGEECSDQYALWE
jgi:hypothetical protein